MTSTPKKMSAFAIYSRNSISNTDATSTLADEVPKITTKRGKMKRGTRRTRNNPSPVATTKRMSKRKKAGTDGKSKRKAVVTKPVQVESDSEKESIVDDVENISDVEEESAKMTNDSENQRMTDDITNERMTDDERNHQSTSDEDSSGNLGANGEEYMTCNGVLSPRDSKIPAIPKAYSCGNPHAEELFKWLITPVSENKFFTEIFEAYPYHIQRHNPTFYQGLFTLKDFSTIMKENHLNYDKQIDLVCYRDGRRTTLQNGPLVYPDYVWSSFEEGFSVRMRNPQAYNKGLWNMCSLLQEYFASSVGANMYLTPSDSQGFPPHYDDIDAFILQIEGTKHWKVYMPVCEEEVLPRFSSKDLNEDEIGYPCMDLELVAGDLLYLPRGYIHQAYASDDHSLHITISTNQLNTWGDLLKKSLPKALEEAIKDNVELRKSLPKDYFEHVGLAFAPTVSEEDSPGRKAFKRKFKQLSMDVLNHLNADAAADVHAIEFLHSCMPPKFTKDECATSIHGNGFKYQAGIVKSMTTLTPDTRIRWIRKRAFRLIVDELGTRLIYTLANSKNSKEEEVIFSDVEDNLLPAISALFKKHPEYIAVKDLPIKGSMDSKLGFAESLYTCGHLVTEEPLPAAVQDVYWQV